MFSEFIARHPKAIIVLIAVSLVFSGYYASQMKIGVDTGRFELKNDAYKTYRNIVETFGSEEDNVIIVAISHNGSVLKRENLLDILRVESEVNGTVEVSSMQSIADYVGMGILILDELEKLPANISVEFDKRIFMDLDRMKNATSNYEYILAHGNESAKNDSYRIFLLLPVYSNSSAPAMPFGGNFTYASILEDSRYRTTVYNATTMLIEEMEILQNLSAAGGGTNISLGVQMPENYSLEFTNDSIEQVEFNITRDKIGMENHNATYVEWYSYNLSFSFALSMLYSGQKGIALGIYRAARDVMENNTARYHSMWENWTAYREEIDSFLRNSTTPDELRNSTEDMKNRSFGTLRDFLDNYSGRLQSYKNGEVGWDEIKKWSLWAENVSVLMENYSTLSWEMDRDALPLVNETIEEVQNSSSYSTALELTRVSRRNLRTIVERIALFYGEKVIYGKVLTILTNLRSILLRDESPQVKQDAWDLLGFSSIHDGTHMDMDLGPFHDALVSYRRWINTSLYGNFTGILWNYLSLEEFSLEYNVSENVSFSMDFSREAMMENISAMSQGEIDSRISDIRNFRNDTVEKLITNYTTELNRTGYNLSRINRDLGYLAEKYDELCGSNATDFVNLLREFREEVMNYTSMVNSTEDEVYGLRMVEDFFSLRNLNFNTLLSGDELSTIVIIGIRDPDYEMDIYRIVKNSTSQGMEYHTLSSKVLVHQIERTATEDMERFLPISLALLIILLYITYRSLRHVLLSLGAVLIVLVWLFAFAAAIGWDMDPILLAVPIMIIGIGIDDGIYVTLRYMEERSTRSRERATMITVASVGGALILTTLTSMAGFLSNTVSSMEDLRRFGVLAAAGLFFSFVAMNTFLPAANMLVDTRRRGRREVSLRAAQVGARIALKNPYVVILIAILLSSAGMLSLQRISTEFNMKDLAPADSEIVVFYHYYQRNFNASVEISYIYMEGNLSSPEVLKAMDEVEKRMKDDSAVVHHYPVLSPWSIMREKAHLRRGEYGYNATFVKLFRESDTDGDGIPDRNITKLYRMLEPEIGVVLRGNRGIFIVHTDSQDLKRVKVLEEELREDAEPLEKYVRVEVAGDAIVGKASLDEINENQIRSLAISITAAIAMLIVLFFTTKRSIVLGIIAALPILFVVTWNWLLMYLLGISLNVMTNTIASLCVGLGIDYGIHITHRFVEETRKFHSTAEALLRATGNLGKGMIGASTTTIASIGILTFSEIPPLSNFALILAFSIFFSFVSAILILPSLLVLWANFRRRHGMDPVDREVREAMRRGDYGVLCRYHLSRDYCLLYAKHLIDKGKIAEARELINELKEEGMDLTDLLRSQRDFNPPFE